MSYFSRIVQGTLGRFLGRLRFPQLFGITVVVFVIDVFVPDGLPFADEIFLGLMSLVLGSLRKRKEDGRETPTRDDS